MTVMVLKLYLELAIQYYTKPIKQDHIRSDSTRSVRDKTYTTAAKTKES